MQRSQNSSFLCLMLMAQENIITAYITEDSDEFFPLTVFLSCFSFFFLKLQHSYSTFLLCVW